MSIMSTEDRAIKQELISPKKEELDDKSVVKESISVSDYVENPSSTSELLNFSGEAAKCKSENCNGDSKGILEKVEDAEDIKSDDEDDVGSLLLDDFLDSLDVLDSWNPDEEELEDIGVDQTISPAQKKESLPKDKDGKKVKEESKRKKYNYEKRIRSGTSRRRSEHRDIRYERDLREILGERSKDTKRRSIHRESSLERPARWRHFQDDFKDTRIRDEKYRHTSRVLKSRREDGAKEQHREKVLEKSKDKEKQVLPEAGPKRKVEDEIRPPPGVIPAPKIKLPSDDLVPPGTEDEYWPKVEGTTMEFGVEKVGLTTVDTSEMPLQSSGSGGAKDTSEKDGKYSSRYQDREKERHDGKPRERVEMRNERFNEEIRRDRYSRIQALRAREIVRTRESEKNSDRIRHPSRDRVRDWVPASKLRSQSRSPRRRSRSPRRRRLSQEGDKNLRRSSPPIKRRRSRSRSRDRRHSRDQFKDHKNEDLREKLRAMERSRRSRSRSRPRSRSHSRPRSRSRSRPRSRSRSRPRYRSPTGSRAATRGHSTSRNLERQVDSNLYERFSSPSLSFELSPVSSEDRIRSLSRSPNRDLRPPTRRNRRSYSLSRSVSSLSLTPEPYPDHLRPRKRIPFVQELERIFAEKLGTHPSGAYWMDRPGSDFKEVNLQTRTIRHITTREEGGSSLEAPPPPVISENKLYEALDPLASTSESSVKSRFGASAVAAGGGSSAEASPFSAAAAAAAGVGAACQLPAERQQLLLLRCEEAMRTLDADGGLSVTGRFIVSSDAPVPQPSRQPLVQTQLQNLRSPLLRRTDDVKYVFCHPLTQLQTRRAWRQRGGGAPVMAVSAIGGVRTQIGVVQQQQQQQQQVAAAAPAPAPAPCKTCEQRGKLTFADSATQTEPPSVSDTAVQADEPRRPAQRAKFFTEDEYEAYGRAPDSSFRREAMVGSGGPGSSGAAYVSRDEPGFWRSAAAEGDLGGVDYKAERVYQSQAAAVAAAAAAAAAREVAGRGAVGSAAAGAFRGAAMMGQATAAAAGGVSAMSADAMGYMSDRRGVGAEPQRMVPPGRSFYTEYGAGAASASGSGSTEYGAGGAGRFRR